MAVLVERFTVVTLAADLGESMEEVLEFGRAMGGASCCSDGELLAVHCLDRHGFRRALETLAARGFEGAATILAATEHSEKLLSKQERAERLARIAATRRVALVYPRQKQTPEWLELRRGPLPGGGPEVSGCRHRRGQEPLLDLPAGWRAEQAVAWRDEYEDGDELLPTWREFLAYLSPEGRERMMRLGPDAILANWRLGGDSKPFAGSVRPSPNVLERERVVREPDGTERVIVDRWVKL